MKLADIAEKLGGILEGDGTIDVRGMASIEDARSGEISFLHSPRYAPFVAATKASAVLVANDWKGEAPCPVIRVPDPDAACARLAAMLGPEPARHEPGVHPTAVVSPDALLGRGVSIGPCCVVEPGARVGDGTVLCARVYLGRDSEVGAGGFLHPAVTILDRVKIGDRVIVHSGAVIGSDGFGYLRNKDASWTKIPQIGTVAIGNDVEIGANTTIDRARFGRTVIGNGVKIDNLVQVAHNVRIGDHTALAAQTGIAGSTTVGARAQFGGQAGVTGHARLGDDVVVAAQAGVTKDVPSGTFVSGYPAMPHDKAMKMHAHMMRIPSMKKRIAELEQRLARLESGRGRG